MKLNNLPLVDRVQGLSYEPSTSADPGAGIVDLQYTDRTQRRHSLKMPVADALYLLNLLEQLSKDEGLDHMRRSQ